MPQKNTGLKTTGPRNGEPPGTLTSSISVIKADISGVSFYYSGRNFFCKIRARHPQLSVSKEFYIYGMNLAQQKLLDRVHQAIDKRLCPGLRRLREEFEIGRAADPPIHATAVLAASVAINQKSQLFNASARELLSKVPELSHCRTDSSQIHRKRQRTHVIYKGVKLRRCRPICARACC